MNFLAQLGQLGAALPPEIANLAPPPQAPMPQEAPVNVMQQAAAPPMPPPPSPPPQAPNMTAEPPRRERRSLIDTVGRIADVIAKVGGAEALYQPTLDSREDRAMGIQDRDRKIQADEIALATGKFNLGDAQNLRVGQVARGAKALAKNGGDAAQAWTSLASRMGLDPATVSSVGQAIATDPGALDGLIAATTDPKFDQAKYGGSVVYGVDKATGAIVAMQPGLGNEPGRNILPEGVDALDPVKFVDAGDRQVAYGSRSGEIITPKTQRKGEKPGAREDRRLRRYTVDANNETRRDIAALKPGAKGAEDTGAFVETARGNLTELRSIYDDLNKRGALVSPAQAADKNVVARIRASGIGQLLEGAVGTEAQTQRDRINSIKPGLMQSIAKATGMTGKQLDSNADVKLFMQTVTDPTKSYEANIKAIEGLERFIAANAKKPEAAKPKAASGWKVVGVK